MFDSINKGDKIRLVIETEFVEADARRIKLTDQDGDTETIMDLNELVTSVEVIERKVITFGQGDLVKNRNTGNEYLILADGGYYSLQRKTADKGDPGFFKSTSYDLVTSAR